MSEKNDTRMLLIRNKSDTKIFIKIYASAVQAAEKNVKGVVSVFFYKEAPAVDGAESKVLNLSPGKMCILSFPDDPIISYNPINIIDVAYVLHQITAIGGVVLEIINPKLKKPPIDPTTLN